MKTILITGSTDGIGLATAKMLTKQGHKVLLHGRTPAKVEAAKKELSVLAGGEIESYAADLSKISAVENLVTAVAEMHGKLDILINNAGVFKMGLVVTEDGLDTRFMVNTIAPYLLTQRLLPLLGTEGRVVNLSSAAQAPVDPGAIAKPRNLDDGTAYAMSKLALTMWTRVLAEKLGNDGPMIVAVNPKSLLGSKMVRDAYGVTGGDLNIGADILCRAALSDEFADASGKYFDNDIGRFSSPHPDALNPGLCAELVATVEKILAEKT